MRGPPGHARSWKVSQPGSSQTVRSGHRLMRLGANIARRMGASARRELVRNRSRHAAPSRVSGGGIELRGSPVPAAGGPPPRRLVDPRKNRAQGDSERYRYPLDSPVATRRAHFADLHERVCTCGLNPPVPRSDRRCSWSRCGIRGLIQGGGRRRRFAGNCAGSLGTQPGAKPVPTCGSKTGVERENAEADDSGISAEAMGD